MSLKGFHIVFVTIATLFFAFLILWAHVFAADEPSALRDAIGYVGIGGLVLLPFYGVYFLRKARKIDL